MRAVVLVNRRTLMLVAFAVAAGLIALAASLTQRAGPSSARAADHLDAPGLTPPRGRRTDSFCSTPSFPTVFLRREPAPLAVLRW